MQFALIPLRDLVILPYAVSPIFLGRGRSINALKKADESVKKLFVALQKDSGIEDPGFNDIHHIGVVANILQTLKLQDGSYKVLLEGIKKARLLNAINLSDLSLADVEIVEEASQMMLQFVTILKTL